MSSKPMESKATEGRKETAKLPERWSAGQKTEVVLRLLRGKDLGEVSREVQVTPPELEEWRRVFLESGQQGLKRRGRDPTERERPNELWGTDATRFYTKTDGWCWFFGAVDHCVSDVVGWHVAKKGDRWAALEPIRQGVGLQPSLEPPSAPPSHFAAHRLRGSYPSAFPTPP